MKMTKNIRLPHEYEKYDCDRCGFTYLKKELVRQDGLLVCRTCYDEPEESDDE